MTVKIDGTNTVANPAFTGADTDTGLQCGTNELKLVTGGTARATVDSSGNVGVGGAAVPTSTVYNSATLHLRQAGSTGSQFRMTTATSGHTTGDGAHLSFWNDNHLYVYNKEAAGHIIFGAGNATQGRFTTNGLCFGTDTAANNALDDYERGTWTPGGIDNFNGITSAEGQYEKIGNLVNVVFQFNYSSLDSSTSSSGINGLPFPVYDFNSLTGVEATSVCFGTNKHVLMYANSGSSNVYFDTAKPLYGSTSTGADFFRGNLTYLAG